MSDIISNAITFGTMVVDNKYVMTMSEIENLGDATGFPDIFPIWCTDNNTIYIFFKTTDGNRIATLESLVATSDKAVWYPLVDGATNVISWEPRVLSNVAPDPVTLTGFNGKSAYQIWLDLGNDGSEQDFIDSLKPDISSLSDEQIEVLKQKLGLEEIEDAIININAALNELIGTSTDDTTP